jgi:thiol-disulfide isomerase/thioredoxin
MLKNTKSIFIWSVIGLTILTGIFFLISANSKPGKLDEFAVCLKDKGAMFYGAFWCPHCQNQKAMFGKSAKLLPYTECSTPDGRGQLASCTNKNIKGYPTWEFADGSRESSEVSLQELSDKTNCQLPQ